ncbi:BTB/POZ domain-containing protein 16 [Nematostella vectensis]|uniref:BTB/POZ domain-containing protein 16 n=1 Tax=Nematostella vectensis TaxID=45351 RepID=UPI0020777D17|nr:BTB/POZ domain-containing protein 16 [Nematostella vectensis]
MADVDTLSSYMKYHIVRGTPSPLPRPYLPALPPHKSTKPSYSRFLVEAPFTALQGVVADARDPPKPPRLPRSRNRIQVGSTNRWRLPSSLGSDLLGSNQALRAATSSYNDTIMGVMTADSPMSTCNHGQSLISVKTQPALSTTVWKHATGQRLLKSQPFVFTYSQMQTNAFDKRSLHSNSKGLQEKDVSLPTPKQMKQIEHHKNFVPPGKRSPTPMEMFLYRSQTANAYKTPDVILHALDTTWELHKPYLQKSSLLSAMLRRADLNSMQNIDEEEEEGQRLVPGGQGVDLQALKSAECEALGSPPTKSDLTLCRSSSSFLDKVLTLKLRIKDPLITKQTFARTLAAMYETEAEMRVEEADVVGVLAAAHFLGFASLERVCGQVMLNAIASWSVCAFHATGSKYKQIAVVDACERWLELNLVPQLSVQIYLSHLPQELLEKTLKSTRLFTWNEYSLYKLLCYWIFLQQHPNLQIMPSWGTVVTWFMSLPKTSSFLEREEGYGYISLFRAVRIDGITDSSQLDEVLKMNVIPQSWLLRVYSQHYHALQGGGDMSLMTRFDQGAVRIGFVIEQPLRLHSEIISLHGFYFEVKAVKSETGVPDYSFFIQRLKPNDPVLSFKACERQTFSMRQDREVRYCLRVQWVDGDEHKQHTTGPQSQVFGFNGKMRRSESFTVDAVIVPLFVTVLLMFPPS